MPSSRGSSPPRDWTSISCVSRTAGRSLYPLSHLGSPAGSYGNSTFSFLRNLHTVLAASTHISTNIVGRFPFLHTLLQHLLLGDFLMMSLLTDVEWYFIAVLICLFRKISDVEHLFMYLNAICLSLEHCLFRFLMPIFWLGCFLFLSCMRCLYSLEIKPLLVSSFANTSSQLVSSFANTSSHSVGCIFILFVVFFAVQRTSLVAQLIKSPHAMQEDLGSIPGLGRSPGEGKGHPLQYSGLENSMDCTVHGVTKSWTRLSDFFFLRCTKACKLGLSLLLFLLPWETDLRKHQYNVWHNPMPLSVYSSLYRS